MIATDLYIAPTVEFIEYAPNGAIIQFGSMALGFIMDMEAAGRNILRKSGATMDHRINLDTLELERKPPCSAVLEGTTLTNLPLPCWVRIDFERYEVTDGVLEMEFVQPGTYRAVVSSGTHMEGVYEVTV